MLDRFLNHLEESQLIPPGVKVVVGYSGGADSTCLLHLLQRVGVDVIAAHLHHGQRSEADKELNLCEAFCQDLGVPFVSGKADVPRMAKDLRIGIEEAGRMARYNFMEQALRSLQCDLIATAHTRSDHVESVLLNLTRGSGAHGLTGIPSRRGPIVRPLLQFSRAETQSYCEEHGLRFHNDPGNDDVNFARVRIRKRVVPELTILNPTVESAISRCAAILDEEDRFLNGAAAAALEQSEISLNGDLAFVTKDVEFAFRKDHLLGLPPVLFKRAVRLAFEALGARLDHDQTQLLTQQIVEDRGSLTAEGGEVVGEWDLERLHIRVLRPTEPFRFGVTMPGETESEEFGWRITAHERETSSIHQQRAALNAMIPRDQVRGELYFRSCQPGDTIQPLGFEGTRKISDLLSEAKLTPAARVRLPLICDFLGPIWLPGVVLSNRMYSGGESSRIIELKFEPL